MLPFSCTSCAFISTKFKTMLSFNYLEKHLFGNKSLVPLIRASVLLPRGNKLLIIHLHNFWTPCFLFLFFFFLLLWFCFFLQITLVIWSTRCIGPRGALVHEGGGSRIREQGSNGCQDNQEAAFQEMTSMNRLNFILEYREYIGLGCLGTNPNLH